MITNLLIVIAFILFVGIIFFIIMMLLDREKRGREIAKILNTRVYLITVPKEGILKKEGEYEPPKDFRQLISVAEQMFSSFASVYQGDLKNKIIKEQEQLSCEIIAHNGLISFYLACPKMLEEMVEKQVHAYYPTAHIEKIKSPNIFKFTHQKGELASATLTLAKKFVLPIKTYLHQESDTISAITNAMSKLDETSAAAFQMIIRPAGENWRRASLVASQKVQEGKSVYSERWYLKLLSGFFDILSGAFHGSSKSNDLKPAEKFNQMPKQQTPMQEALLKAINEKAAKNSFDTIIRIISVAANRTVADTHLQGITAAFAQLGSPDLNSFKVNHGNNQTVKDYILRRFIGKSSILNTEELATIYHLPIHSLETPNIRWLLAKEMPAPANLPDEGTILGKSIYRDIEKLVKIKTEDRRRHIFMIGKTGVGKTTLFANAFEQDIRSGFGGCFIDPLGDAIEDILTKIPPERQDDIVLFDPGDVNYPVGLNLLEYQTAQEKDFIISETIQIFYKLFDPGQTGIVGPQWEHWFRNAALTVMNQPGGGTLIDIPRIFTDDAFRAKIVNYVTDPIVKNFWQQQLAKTADFHKSEMYNYFISKFGRFMTNELMRNIIGQKKSSFNLRQIMDEGKILLINLSKGKIGEINSNLLGMIIVSKIQMAAFSRADISEEQRRDFYLYVDEFQNFTTDSFTTILSEARKYHLNLNITNQYIAQLKENIRDAVIGNVGTMISYLIGAADAEFMIKEFPGISVSDFTNLDKFHAYCKLLIDGMPSKPFSMQGVKSETKANETLREQIRMLTRKNYARPLAEVNTEILENLKATNSTPPTGVNEPLKNI